LILLVEKNNVMHGMITYTTEHLYFVKLAVSGSIYHVMKGNILLFTFLIGTTKRISDTVDAQVLWLKEEDSLFKGGSST
jgi:hypothetical protein